MKTIANKERLLTGQTALVLLQIAVSSAGAHN